MYPKNRLGKPWLAGQPAGKIFQKNRPPGSIQPARPATLFFGSGVCEHSFGQVTFECGHNASQKQMHGDQNHPKARPETTQKAPKVNLGVPRSKEAPKVGSTRFNSFSGYPFTRKKL